MLSRLYQVDQAMGELGYVWSIIVPVKALAHAKTRLSPQLQQMRSALALAFACDTVAAAAKSRNVRRIYAVTSDPFVAKALSEMGIVVVVEDPAERGLNAAVLTGE